MEKSLNVFILGLACLGQVATAAGGGFPKLFFEYGSPHDLFCHADSKKPITDAMKKDLLDRMPSFERLWRAQGEPLLETTTAFMDKPFGRIEETLTLVLCPWTAPMSSPLVIRMREYLKTATVDGSADFETTLKPESYFVSQVFHEMLHRYLDHNFPRITEPAHSALIKEYSKEPDGVLVHLHLLALQSAVFIRAHRETELKDLIALDSKIPNPIYSRAWTIVNKVGYERFIAELRAYRD